MTAPRPPTADEIHRLVAAVGWSHRVEDIAAMIEGARVESLRDESSGNLTAAGARWDYGDDVGRLGLMVVDPALQRQGLGRAVLDRLLAHAPDVPVELVATAAGRDLYRAFGFEPVGRVHQLQGEWRRERQLCNEVRLADVEDRTALLRLDRAAFGADRSTILVGLLERGRGFILEAHGRICGYAIAHPFGPGTVIGPIIAESSDHASTLVQAALEPGLHRIDLTDSHDQLESFLEGGGVRAVARDLPSMRRGTRPLPPGPARVFALAGQSFG